MSAALQLPQYFGVGLAEAAWQIESNRNQAAKGPETYRSTSEKREAGREGLAFYRKHTEKLLRRYLYASVQVGRTPELLSEPLGRGWASSRPVRSFEDAVIFVIDIESCLKRLDAMDRELLSRVVLQEYTQFETAELLGMCVRTVSSRLAKAIDRLTELLLEARLLIIPE